RKSPGDRPLLSGRASREKQLNGQSYQTNGVAFVGVKGDVRSSLTCRSPTAARVRSSDVAGIGSPVPLTYVGQAVAAAIKPLDKMRWLGTGGGAFGITIK